MVAGQSPDLPGDQQSVSRYFNAAAFAAPAPLTLGNSGVMNVRGPGLHSLDGGILKRIAIREQHALQLADRIFNLYNHPSWGAPNTSLGTAAFNTINCGKRSAAAASVRAEIPVLSEAAQPSSRVRL